MIVRGHVKILVFFQGRINTLGNIRLHWHIHAKTSKANQNAKSTELFPMKI